MRRPALTLTALACAGLLLAGCDSGDPRDRELDLEDVDPTTPPPIDAGPDAVPVDCADVAPAAAGVWEAGDAGTVRVDVEDAELALASVEPADGWEHEVVEDDALRIEVRFRPVDGERDEDAHEEDDVASGPREHLQDTGAEEVITLIVASGPSADDADPAA